MTGQFTLIKGRDCKPQSPGEAIFRFIVGGSKKRIWPIFDSALTFVDNEREINELRYELRYRHDVQFLVVGEGATTYGLAELATKEVQDAIKRTANTSLFDGCCARQAIAQLAAQRLAESEDFKSYFGSLPDQVYLQTNGSPRLVTGEFLFSNGGAVGKVLSVFIAHHFSKTISRMGLPCQVIFDALGPITFAGVSPRSRPNSAVATAGLVHTATTIDMAFEKGTSKFINFHELPTLQYDMKRRTELIILDRLAMSSAQTKAMLAISSPNDAGTNELGAILSRDVDFYHSLDRAKDMAAHVAESLYEFFEQAMSDVRPDKSIVKGVEFDLRTRTPVRRAELKSVIANCTFDPIDTTLSALDRPEDMLSHTMRIVAAPGSMNSDVIPEHVDRTMSEYPQTVRAYVDKLATFLTFQLVVNREIQAVSKELAALKNEVLIQKQRLAKYLLRIRGKRMASPPSDLVKLAGFLRDAADKRELLEAQLNAAARGKFALETEIDFLRKNYESILQVLNALRPRNTLESKKQLIVAYGIDTHFAELQHLPNLSEEEQVNLLCRYAGCLTRAGLAKIVGIATDRVEPIAHAILFGDYPTKSPTYAGQARSFYQRRFYSIPPCDADTETLLDEAMKKLDPKAIVEFHDDITHGACICRVTLRRFAKTSDLFPKVVGSALKDAKHDERYALNSPDGFRSIDELGGRESGDCIEFDDRHADSRNNEETADGGSDLS